jgi:L-histidine Nalpha-methyltransferase
MRAALPMVPVVDGFDDEFGRSVLAGLAADPKRLESKYLYDARGAELFDAICKLDEYYPTRTEIGLLRAHASEIALSVGAGAALIELGSGASVKSRLLLDALEAPAGYVPVDISEPYLKAAAERLRPDYPDLPILPLIADFTRPLSIPDGLGEAARLLFFPGSTIGNLEPEKAAGFLRRMARDVQPDAFLIGVDLKKDEDRLVRAYDDEAGVTAAFNLNLLRRINVELGADFNLDGFAHEARWNPELGRIEMHLVSRHAQEVRLLGHRFTFAAGESIHTENSYKYALEEFAALAAAAAWRTVQAWVDPKGLFSIHMLAPASPSSSTALGDRPG